MNRGMLRREKVLQVLLGSNAAVAVAATGVDEEEAGVDAVVVVATTVAAAAGEAMAVAVTADQDTKQIPSSRSEGRTRSVSLFSFQPTRF
jgi:hypothetical protein